MQQAYPLRRCLALAVALLGLAPAALAQNVGIGTTSPTQTLDVNGSLRVRGLSGSDTRLPIVQPDGTLGVSQPLSPVTTLASPLNLGNVAVSSPTGAAISGNYLYVTHNSPNELLVFDISNPTLPVAVPAGTVAGGSNLDLLTVRNGYVYVCDFGGSTIRVYSLLPATTPAGSPTAPALLGTFATGANPDGVTVVGNYLYVANYSNSNVQVFNLTGPGGSLTSPPSLGTFATSPRPADLKASPDGRYLYVAIYDNNKLEVYDLQASATAPPLATTLPTGNAPQALAVANNLLYLTNATSNTLYIYGLSTPGAPSFQSSTPTGGTPYGFDVQGNYAYLTNTSSNQVRVLQLTQSNSLGFNGAGELTSVPNSALGDNLGNGVATTNVNLNGNYLVGGTLTTPGTSGLGIDASGRVGVGTLAPSQKLDVRGNLRLGDNGNAATGAGNVLEFVGPGVNTGPVGLYRVNPVNDQSELRVVVGDAADANDKFAVGYTSGSTEGSIPGGTFTPRFVVRGDGRVGVGTTTPRARFDVASGDSYLVENPDNGTQQSVYLPGHLFLAPYNGTSGLAFIQARVPSPTSSTNLGLAFRTTSAGNLLEPMNINANGNVNLPYTLSMTANDGDKIFLTGAGAGGSKIGHGTGWGVLNYAGPGTTTTTGYHSWLTTVSNAYAEQMRLTSTGLGLGTTPATRLHVAGTAGTSNVRLESLGGTGTRLVTADASGNLAPTTGGSLLNRLLTGQSGTATLGSNNSGDYANYTITFPTAFTAAPSQLICTVRTQNGQTYNDTFAVTTKSITATSFQINLKRVDVAANWGQTLLLDWIAIP